jgi:Arc/MetJ family transcription regulator
MRTNIVLDADLIAEAMKKSGARTMRETIDVALREYVTAPDYAALLALETGLRLLHADRDFDRIATVGPWLQRLVAQA